MIGHEIDAATGDELVAFVRALGRHRYVASRLHLVHAFAIEAAEASGPDPALEEARTWARAVLEDPGIDRGSKDERLHRRATDAELVAVVTAFWASDRARAEAARARLAERLREIGVEVPDAAAVDAPLPFDDEREDDVFPVLVDAGWELLRLAELDAERHKGAIANFGDLLAWEVARFEEENAVPPLVHLHELPALGPIELLAALDPQTSAPRAPFVLWVAGDETYQDYVLRGATKAAGLAREG
jgi:hypothetical protein